MKKIKGILILITLLVLIMGVASATEVSTDTLSTNTPTTSADNSDTIEVGEQTSIETSVTGSTDSLNTKNVGKNSTNTKENTHEDDKIVKNDKTSVKTSSHTYTVDTYDKLQEAIYTMDYDDITINIESDIVLTGSKGKYEDWTIKKLVINGNNHIIDGDGQYNFLWLGSKWNITINDITFTNCFSNVHGGTIDNYGAYFTINNCTFTNSKSYFGGAIDNQMGCTIILNYCKFTNNKAIGTSSGDEMGGGAIFNEDSTIIMNNCVLMDNTAAETGGAIYNKGTAYISESIINNNNASVKAGAIYNWGGNLTIKNSTFNYNKAEVMGGAIVNSWANLNISNSEISYNVIDERGGAIYNHYGVMTIKATTLNNNDASINGGAVYNNYGTITLNNNTLNNNKAKNRGGAVYNNFATTILNNSRLNNNDASNGGAIYNDDEGGTRDYKATLIIENCTLNNNSGQYGGVISNNATNLKICNSKFTNNTAEIGGAIANLNGTLNIYDSLLKGNVATSKIFKISLGGAILNDANANIINNKFINNGVDSSGVVILSNDQSTIRNNINAGTSEYYGGTIYSTRSSTLIEKNIFYEKPFETSIIISSNNTHPIINENINITFQLIDQFEINLPGEYLNITINNQTSHQKTDDDGIVTIEYTPTDKEIIKINAAYDGNNDYIGTESTLNITVRTTTEILIDDISTVVGQICNINGKLLDTMNNPVKQENVYINVDNHTYTLTTNDLGEFTTTTTFPKPGKYDMIILFNGNDYYTPSNKTRTVKVIPQSNIEIEILNNTEKNVKIEITVTSETGKIIPAQKVNITLPNGTKTTQQTNTNGKISITDTTAAIGEKTITAQIKTNQELNGTSQTKKITIIPDYQKIIEDLISTNNKQNKTIKDQNNTIQEQNNTIKKQNNTINNLNKQINTLNNTNKQLNQQLNDAKQEIQNLNNTINNLNKELNDSKKKINSLNNSNKELTKQLNQAKKEIQNLNATINNLTQQLNKANNENKKLNNTINNLTKQLNDANNVIANLNTTVKNLTQQILDANKTITSLQDKNKNLTQQLNKANNQITTLNNKIKQLEATIKELNKTTTKKTTTTTVTQLKGRVGAITQLKATIKDSNGNPVPDGRVVFKVNGITVKDEAQNTIYAIVNNGTATIKYTIPKSWYKDNTIVEATYGETHNYLSSKGNSTKNNITPGNVKIKIADLPVHENGDKLQFVITATDESGESMTGGVVIMKTNGVTLKDSNGKALQANVVNGVAILDYNITLGARTHNLTAVYAYTGYNRVEAKNTLNVTKGEIFIRYNPVITKTAKTTVTADILDKNKNHMYGNVTVGIRVDGEMVTISDAIEGIINVTLPITFTKGIHSIEFVVGETGAFKSDRLTSIIIKN